MTCAQVLAYIYIIVNFELRSSIHAGLTDRSLYNRFALKKNLPKWVLGEFFFSGGYDIWWEQPTPWECNDHRSTSFGEKNYGDTVNTLVCTHGKEITKKNIKNGMSTP